MYEESQPNTTPIARFQKVEHPFARPQNGKMIGVPDKLIVYVMNNGLIRVIHRKSARRMLIRGHAGFVSDVAFYQIDSSVFATVG